MILKSNDRHIKQLTLQNDILDQTAFALLCIQVYQVQSFHVSLICFVILPK